MKSRNLAPHDPIAIVGLACRYPGGAHSPEELWRLLCEGFDAIGEVPEDRWDKKRFYDPDPRTPSKTAVALGGYLTQKLDEFDAAFFGISPREAACLDPQQRLLLECTWEALEDAGIPPERLAKSDTGVFSGGFMQDSASIQMGYLNRDFIGQHTSVGASLTMLSARISYAFDLRGPCISIDTACSSSLVATHYACNSLWNDECSHALVAGVNVMFNPAVPIALTKAGFLAPDGRCKAFDERANGYVRSEGAGVVVLKRLSHALRDRDRVYALIRGGAVNQDGRSDGITQPTQESQELLMREAYARAGLSPTEVHYVEAHGTGTPVGDRTEASAIANVIGAGRTPERMCVIGSVKTNLGHMEGAAGVGGLMKAALALKHRRIPAHLHLKRPAPHIPFGKNNLRVATQLEAWPVADGPAYASVNSFGYGGTNAHIVLEEAPANPPADSVAMAPALPARLLPVSAKTPKALRAYAESLASWLRERNGVVPLEDVLYSAGSRRSHHEQRAAFTGASADELAAKLSAFSRGEDAAASAVGRVSARAAKTVFVFTGMGPQWWGMARQAFSELPAFKQAAEECDAAFRRAGASSVLAELLKPDSESRMGDAYVAQTTNFLVQVALVASWKSLGVTPDIIVGHSAGEAAAAYCAGALSLDDAARVCFHRSRLQARTAGSGRMLAVDLPAAQVEKLLAPYQGDVCIGAYNAPSSVALSGRLHALEAIAAELSKREVFHRFIHGNVPYHSALMAPLERELRQALAAVRPEEARIPLFSSALGKRVMGSELGADYWWRNVRAPVLFESAMGKILDEVEQPIFVEVGPHPVLAAAIGACASSRKRNATVVASLHRKQEDVATLMTALSRLYVAGATVQLQAQHSASARFVPLPSYPWQREHHWLETPASRRDRLGQDGHPLLRHRIQAPIPTWEADLCAGLLPYLPDHRVQQEVVFPGAGYVDAAMAMQREVHGAGQFTVERLSIHSALVIPAGQGTTLRLAIHPESGEFTMHSYRRGDEGSWLLHATGRMLKQPVAPEAKTVDLAAARSRCQKPLDAKWVYASLEQSGLLYGPWFQGIRELYCNGSGEAVARIALGPAPLEDEEHHVLHPALLDACFQTLIVPISDGEETKETSPTYLPVGMDEVRLGCPLPREIWAYGRFAARTDTQVAADLWLCDAQGTVLAEVRGARARALPRAAETEKPTDGWFYEVRWERQPLEVPESVTAERLQWLLFGEATPLLPQLREQLVAAGQETIMVRPGERFARLDHDLFEIAPEQLADVRSVLAELSTGERGLRAIYIARPEDEEALAATGVQGCCRLLPVIQGLAGVATGATRRLWVVTQGAQRVADERIEDVSGAPLWAMAGMSNVEHPKLRSACVDLDPSSGAAGMAALVNELLHGGTETEVAFRGGERFVARLDRVSPTSATRRELVSTNDVPVAVVPAGNRGRPATPLFERAQRGAPGPGQVEIEVHATGISFKDIAKLSDPELEGSFTGKKLGVDCAGVVTAVGPGVSGLSVGDAVLAAAPGSLATHVIARAIDVWPKPPWLGFEESTALGSYIHAIYALGRVARLGAKETVLIHSAAGGTGLAAVHYAKLLGAEVLATAGTPEKRAYLESLGVARAMDSRSLAFADEVLAHTKGRGVDVVFNTLTGSALRRSLTLLAPHGRFVDLTYFGGEEVAVSPGTLPRNVSLLGVDLDSLFSQRPEETRSVMDEMAKLTQARAISPLPAKVFDAAELPEALAHLSQRKNIGRAVVRMRPAQVRVSPSESPTVRSDGTYLITGGLGGFGMATAQWLAERGAKSLVLVGRRGAQTDEARQGLKDLEARGVAVTVLQADVSREEDVRRVLEHVQQGARPLRGVIHAAASFGGEFLVESTPELLRRAMLPKMLGAWYLHQLTRGTELDFFVLYSSVAGSLGETGTAAYCAANHFLDALAQLRQSQGLPATSMGWGLVGDVGIGVKDARVGALVRSVGHKSMPVMALLEVLGEALVTKPAHVMVTDTDWGRWALTHPLVKTVPRLSPVLPRDASSATEADGQSLREMLQSADGAARQQLLESRLADQLALVLRTTTDKIDMETPLGDLGMDSLMASELSARLEKQTGVMVPVMVLMRRSTVRDVVKRLLDSLDGNAQPAANENIVVKPTQHSFPSEDTLTIYGHLSLPPGPGPHPVVVVHTAGMGGALDVQGAYVQLREHAPLLERGYAVFTVDQRGAPGHGEHYARMGAMGDGDVSDLISAARYVRTLPDIDGSRVAVMGTSRGAYAALLAACGAPETFSAAVLAMGFYEPVAFVRSERQAREDSSPLRDHAGQRWEWDDIEQYFAADVRRPLAQLKRLRARLFILHGDADGVTAPEQAIALERAAREQGAVAELQMVPSMDHDLEHRHPAWPKIWDRAVEFLNRDKPESQPVAATG